MALVLNEEGSTSEREISKLRARNESLSARVTKLEADLHDREEKAKIHTDTMAELRVVRGDLAKLEEKKRSVDDRVAELEAAMAPANHEPEEALGLVTRADLVGKIKDIADDC
ncbi:hypothetical protein A2U01_0058850, partial [Trifolium medium]|nr:hypothetical protein [Trifolium medium]